jgi:hypothetical protein
LLVEIDLMQWEGAAQQVAGADQAIEIRFWVRVGFAALRLTFGVTAPAAWRLSSSRYMELLVGCL